MLKTVRCAALLGALIVFGTSTPTVAREVHDEALVAPIPPQPLSSALDALTANASLQLIYSSSLGQGLSSPGTSHPLPWREALEQVLRGTGLTYEFVNDRTLTIVRARERNVASTASDSRRQSRKRGKRHQQQTPSPGLAEEIIVTGSHLLRETPVGTAGMRTSIWRPRALGLRDSP
jgi:hypothetical protein